MPYTPVSITGYNANPPEDDGSATTTNEIAWQKHLDKIGAPLKTAIEATQTNVGASVDAIEAEIDAIDVKFANGLTAIAALAKTDGNFIVGNGTTWVAESGATVRTSLGLGSAALKAFGTSGDALGALNGVNTYAGTHTFTNAAWNLITFASNGASNGKQADAAGVIHSSRTGSGADNHYVFYNANGGVGNIQTSGSSTVFNTSSDARLKTNLKPAKDVGAVIDDIKIYDFIWEADGTPGFGPVAQELHKVLPSAVSVGGDDPKLEPWSWDASKLVPYLIVELQALRKRVAELEAK